MIRIIALLFLSLPLASCGLHPLYAPSSATYGQLRNNVEVMPIPGKEGYLVYTNLIDRLGEVSDGATPLYRLQVILDDDIVGEGLLGNRIITRERRSLRARFRLLNKQTNQIVIDNSAGSDVGIDVVSSEYATIAAEDRALENLAAVVAQEIIADLSIAIQSEPQAEASQ